MAKQSYKNNVITPVGRMSYPFVVDKLVANINGSQIEKWGVELLFPKNADLSELKSVCEELIKMQWPKATPELVKKIRVPFKDGNENFDKNTGELKPGYEGTIYLTLDSKTQAPVVKHANGEVMTPEEAKVEIYSGCYGRALINAGTYDHLGNKGVKFYLSAVQKCKDGEPMGPGKTTAAQVDKLMQAFDDQDDATDNSDLLS
jgi:hypothetical protein